MEAIAAEPPAYQKTKKETDLNEFVPGLRENDAATVTLFYKRMKRLVRAKVESIAGRAGVDVEAAVHDVFLIILRDIREKYKDGNFNAWVMRIATNLSINLACRTGRKAALLSLRRLEPSQSSDSQEQGMIRGQWRQRLGRAIADLSQRHRELLLLHYSEELSYSEIADTLGIAKGTVMSGMARARAKLLEVLHNECPGLDLKAVSWQNS